MTNMASIFTFDPDPPQLSSPWLTSDTSDTSNDLSKRADVLGKHKVDQAESLFEVASKVTAMRLEAEPQEGPTEYKLHLLLRPRQQVISSTTGMRIAGSRPKPQSSNSMASGDVTTPSTPTYYSGSRQHRLEQLTTQLLWRLQQSSPYHSTSADSIILPSLPEATPQLQAPPQLAKLLPGLEESKGALYEIGVADDGTLVGLTEDEMQESLNNLRAMAASLGCDVKVLRMVEVGECKYYENEHTVGTQSPHIATRLKKGKLCVSEAYVKPMLSRREATFAPTDSFQVETGGDGNATAVLAEQTSTFASDKEQLRVSLTGATTSGKSSLLGTLSTSTLDNGRGKSRLSLLKHRHEIASGMTSSVAQELIGYHDRYSVTGNKELQVVNYATGNVSSWDDIHASSASRRLAFLCDSAGHPRFRRTTVRGLVGWAPHWTLMCIAADTSAEIKVQDSPLSLAADDAGAPASVANIAMAHLNLCLKLELPLVVVITKLDAATKDLLRKNLSDVLTQLKGAGRRPIMIKNNLRSITDEELKIVHHEEQQEIMEVCNSLSSDPVTQVPILFSSAVKGIGVDKLHALLRYLPITRAPALSSFGNGGKNHDVLFHVDDTFNLRSKYTNVPHNQINNNTGLIISGHISRGNISVGDELLLGPFSWTTSAEEDEHHRRPSTQQANDPFLSPRSFGEALHRTTAMSRAHPLEEEWVQMRVISIRNLRLPVRELHTDQAGTMGTIPVDTSWTTTHDLVIRKGMVLANKDMGAKASHAFTAAFSMSEASSVFVGSIVIIYCATVRAAAKVVAVQLQDSADATSQSNGCTNEDSEATSDDEGFGFSLDEEIEPSSSGTMDEQLTESAAGILVTFQLLSCREWIGVGAKVLVMPGGSVGQGLAGRGNGFKQNDKGKSVVAGLDGYVGKVVERFG